MKNSSPAVSVIVPMYNAEKFLSVCLESILIQTLKDFEVIVVNDRSTDSSLALAESYLEKFGGRLKIITLPQNTGSAAVPRNVGLECAQGKYIFFTDNDDFLVDNALETLFNLAEEYQSDVVSMMSGFFCDEKPVPEKLFAKRWLSEERELIIDTENFEERMKYIWSSQYERVPWSRFLRRKFLFDNRITFPSMKIADDTIWNLKLIFTAKTWVRTDVPLYVQRHVPDSHSRKFRTPEQTIIFLANPLIHGVECLEEFMRELEYFKQNPVMRLQVINFFVQSRLDLISKAFTKVDSTKVYEIYLREFKKAGSTQPALISYLLLMTNLYRNELKALT